MTQNDRFKINKHADLVQLGRRLEDAMEFHEVHDYDAVRDMLFELHHQIYPNASRPITLEEWDQRIKAAQTEALEPFAVNWSANLADLGTLANEALCSFDDGDFDSLRDQLFKLHNQIYPNASRPATPEENASIAASEPKADRPNLTVLMFQR